METIRRFFEAPERSFFLFGPRGTGKSTLVQSLFPDARYIDLLDAEEQRWYSARPERLREQLAAMHGPLDRPEEIEGHALEGLVGQHLRAWADYSSGDAALHYWRTRSGVEVDFVVYGPEGIAAIEVKNGNRVYPRDTKPLRAFREDYPIAKCCLLYRGRERLVQDGVLCLPVEDFLIALRPGAWVGEGI